MRTTITIDDSLFEEACVASGEKNASHLVAKALKFLVASERKKRLMLLSGKVPGFNVPERSSRSVGGAQKVIPVDYRDIVDNFDSSDSMVAESGPEYMAGE